MYMHMGPRGKSIAWERMDTITGHRPASLCVDWLLTDVNMCGGSRTAPPERMAQTQRRQPPPIVHCVLLELGHLPQGLLLQPHANCVSIVSLWYWLIMNLLSCSVKFKFSDKQKDKPNTQWLCEMIGTQCNVYWFWWPLTCSNPQARVRLERITQGETLPQLVAPARTRVATPRAFVTTCQLALRCFLTSSLLVAFACEHVSSQIKCSLARAQTQGLAPHVHHVQGIAEWTCLSAQLCKSLRSSCPWIFVLFLIWILWSVDVYQTSNYTYAHKSERFNLSFGAGTWPRKSSLPRLTFSSQPYKSRCLSPCLPSPWSASLRVSLRWLRVNTSLWSQRFLSSPALTHWGWPRPLQSPFWHTRHSKLISSKTVLLPPSRIRVQCWTWLRYYLYMLLTYLSYFSGLTMDVHISPPTRKSWASSTRNQHL